VASRTSPQDALADACARAGLDASGASVLYDRSNTVYKIAGEPVVVRLRYAPGSGAWRDRLATSVQVTGWLHEQGFPAVRPLDIPQPVEAHGYLVTFWHFLPASGPPWEDVESLGRLLRRLHGLGDPPAELPPARPMSSLHEDAERCPWLTGKQRSWILGRAGGTDPPVRRDDLDAGPRDDPRRRRAPQPGLLRRPPPHDRRARRDARTGPAAETAHRDTGRLTADLGIDILLTVGHGLMDTPADAARTSPAPPAIHAADDPDALLPVLRRLLQPGDVVFIKASRSVGLENFATILKEDGPARTGKQL